MTSFMVMDESSSSIEHFMAGMQADEPAISRWVEVEIASLPARNVRMGNISADDAREANALLADVIAPSFIVLLPSAGDYQLAAS